VEDFARYLYLPRIAGPEVLAQAIRDGVALLTWQMDTFAYADRFDETAGRYPGLRCGQQVAVTSDDGGVLVMPAAARRQLDLETKSTVPAPAPGVEPGAGGFKGPVGPKASPTQRPTRYHGSVQLDPGRVGRDASRIADEVLAHLTGLVGAEVRVTLEIEARLEAGAPDQVVRTVTENSRALKFATHGFERE